ncbi:TatD family hydrolase [Flavitalea sp.]|nr:TatD family hydrolase [Flavitalea sp.]
MRENYLVDTHSHLYSEEFSADIAEILRRAETEGVKKIFLPAIDSNSANSMFQLEKTYPDQCFAMMGLHPCYVKENYQQELDFVRNWLETRKFAAVGEIGLDYYWDRNFDKEQMDAFSYQVDLAMKHDLPIVIHSRDSMHDTIAMIKSKQNGKLRGIFHCFSGTYEQALEIIELGFLLGIGGVLTYKKSGLSEVVEKLPMDALVLETDAPYLTPVPFRGKRNESSYLKYIVSRLAEVKRLPEEEIARITTANAEKLFNW